MLRLLPFFLALMAGCRTTVVERIAPAPAVAVQRASAVRSWDVVEAGSVVGRVVLYEDAGAREDAVYIVQNPLSQDLGLIDGLGRAWRYRPHEEQAQWIMTGTISEGAASILGAGTSCSLEETSLQREPATLLALEPAGDVF